MGSLRGGHTMKVWILFGILACIAWRANSAALDDYQDALDEEELNHLMNYIGTTESRMEKRGRKFCLRRDMTCPNVEGKRDFCCKGSQCACNILDKIAGAVPWDFFNVWVANRKVALKKFRQHVSWRIILKEKSKSLHKINIAAA